MGRKLEISKRDVRDIIVLEGRRRPIQQRSVNSNVAIPGSGNQIGLISSMPGFVTYVKDVYINCATKKLDIEITVGSISPVSGISHSSGQSEDSFKFKIRQIFPRGTTRVPIEDFCLGGNNTSVPLRVIVYEAYNDDDTVATDKSYLTYVQITGHEIYEDFEFNNPKALQILGIGDSVMRGTPNVSEKRKHYMWYFKNLLTSKGKSSRICNRALGGSTSVEHDKYIGIGYYDTSEWDVILYALGVNDTNNASYMTDYQTSLQNAIAWKRNKYPNSKFIVLSPHRSSISGNETKYANIRSIASSVVTATNDPNVLHCNLGEVDLSVVPNAYYTADGAGVHLNDEGYLALWNNKIMPFMNTIF